VKALYLDGSGQLEVRLDGPALRVRRPGRADGLYPIPRVSRIIVLGRVRWQPDALAACLREHKPVSILDNGGRLVRLLFHTPPAQYGLAARMGELLRVPKFAARYERWVRGAEWREMASAIQHFNAGAGGPAPDQAWQFVCRRQYQRWGIRVGAFHRFLRGLAAAQIASALLLAGMRRNSRVWDLEEYRVLCDMIRLERWRQVQLLEDVLCRLEPRPLRRELTAAFESTAEAREQRIAEWRRCALLEMTGGHVDRRRRLLDFAGRAPASTMPAAAA